LKGEPITPYKHSMYRPMLYVDVGDVCKAFERFARKILNGVIEETRDSLSHIVNVYYPEPITILELAEIVRDVVVKLTNGKVNPKIEIIDRGKPALFTEEDKDKIKVDLTKAKLLDLERLTSPKESINRLIRLRLFSEKWNEFKE